MTETPNPHIVDADSLTGEMHPIRRVVVALGSNLGERLASLQGAVDALADTTLPAARLMERALAIEDAFERERSEVRNAPRTLDVDLVVVGDRRSNEDFLRLPHPRAHERAFVLQPWHDLEPDAVFPDRGPISELLQAADSTGVKKRDDLALDVE